MEGVNLGCERKAGGAVNAPRQIAPDAGGRDAFSVYPCPDVALLMALSDELRFCRWCEKPLPSHKIPSALYCNRGCVREAYNAAARAAYRPRPATNIPGRLCVNCGGEIPSSKPSHTRFCRDECSRDWYRSPKFEGLSNATVGAVQELRVAADLLIRGFAVFRAMSPSCDCDLAVMKDGRLHRVEVTNARLSPTGNVNFPRHDEAKYDVLALVFPDGEIEYRPPWGSDDGGLP